MLNTANHAPPVALVLLWRLLRRLPSEGMPRQRAADFLGPSSLAAGQSRAGQALRDALALGLIDEFEGRISLTEQFRFADESRFHAEICHQVLNTKHGAPFQRGIRWYMRLPAWGAPPDVTAILQRARDEGSEPLPSNESVVRGFMNWVTFLGFGWIAPWGKRPLVSDGTEAVGRYLPKLFGEDNALEAGEFLRRIHECLMVAGEESVWFASGPSTSGSAVEVPSSLSRALVVLRRTGMIDFEYRDDGAGMFLRGPGDAIMRRSVASVLRRGGQDA